MPDANSPRQQTFFEDYLQYTSDTESPAIYHRWCAITSAGANLGRSIFFQHGSFRYFPNIFCMLLGEPAARKSTSIKLAKKLLSKSGYSSFAATKTSKEKFLMDVAGLGDSHEENNSGAREPKLDDTLNNLGWGKESNVYSGDYKEAFIVADEFNEFAGAGNVEFYDILGSLWDWDDEDKPYEQRFKNSKSVQIWQPTISILAGNTPENFARAFPPETIGTGFLSRILLIHGARTGKRIAFPTPPRQEDTDKIQRHFADMRGIQQLNGACSLSPMAMNLLTTIYEKWEPIEDVRLISYSSRRFTHLLKLCLVVTGAQLRREVTYLDVIRANTYLTAAEINMTKALGEFGKNRNSDVVNKIMRFIEEAEGPRPTQEIWKHVQRDVESPSKMQEILNGLQMAEKVQLVTRPVIGVSGGYLPKHKPRSPPQFIDWELLTEEERNNV